MSEKAKLKREIEQVIMTLEVIAQCPYPLRGFGDAYKQIGVNFSLPACEIAAKITGAQPFFCKMLNYKFRNHAAELMFERALAELT